MNGYGYSTTHCACGKQIHSWESICLQCSAREWAEAIASGAAAPVWCAGCHKPAWRCICSDGGDYARWETGHPAGGEE